MKRHFTRAAGARLALAAFLTLVAGAAAARADEVLIQGYTNGCFSPCVSPAAGSAAQTTSLFALQYVNSTFTGETVGGFRGLGGNAQAPPIQNLNNLGAFQLAPSLANYNGSTFTLLVTFVAPEGIVGPNAQLFTAMLTGAVSSVPNGGVLIDFNNTPTLFTFNDPNCGGDPSTTCGSGSFFFAVNDLAISPGQVADLTGQITGASQTSIPEPTTMLLLGTGLSASAALTRRRNRRRRRPAA